MVVARLVPKVPDISVDHEGDELGRERGGELVGGTALAAEKSLISGSTSLTRRDARRRCMLSPLQTGPSQGQVHPRTGGASRSFPQGGDEATW
jgi:hypothetical protein